MNGLTIAASGSVSYLADISSDGTSNGIIMTLTRLFLAGCAVLLAAGFGLNIVRTRLDKTKSGSTETKEHVDETKNFVLAEGLIAVVWTIIEIAHSIFVGAAGGGG